MKIKINVNGKEQILTEEMTITEFLKAKGQEPKRVVVEYNKQIIDRDNWNDTILQENDQLEVLKFVGGG